MKATEKQMATLRQYLFVPGCHLQTSMGKIAQRTLDSRREVSRSRREVSTIVGNESGDCRPPVWSCWLHFRSCQKPSPVKNENFVRVYLQSWSSNNLATWYEQPTHWKRPWCWERLKAEGEEGNRGWDGWMASLMQWTWTWANSRRWWSTGKCYVLQSMESWRVRYHLVTEK